MYIYIYIYIYTHVYIHIYISIYTYTEITNAVTVSFQNFKIVLAA